MTRRGYFQLIAFSSFIVLVLACRQSFSQIQNSSFGDHLAATALLEELISRRLTTELSTQIDEKNFRLGVQAQVQKRGKDPAAQPLTPLSDLELGFLNPDELLSQANANRQEFDFFIKNFSLSKLKVHLGLQPGVSDEVDKEITAWLNQRLKAEFGNLVESETHRIRGQDEVLPPQPKSLSEKLRDFQELVGSFLLALGLTIAAFLVGLFYYLATKQVSPLPDLKLEGELESRAAAESSAELSAQKAVNSVSAETLTDLKTKILDLSVKIGADLSVVIEEWCLEGEKGLLKTAALAEACANKLGRLPIPEQFKKQLTTLFTQQGAEPDDQRLDLLNEVYWALLATVNFGGESLRQPFSFLGGAEPEQTSKILLQNNLKLQAVTALYMPDSLRTSYLDSLNPSQKVALLAEAATMAEIEEQEFQSIENQMAGFFKKTSDTATIALDNTFSKIADSLSIIESFELLPQVKGPVLEKFKRTQPALAFFHEWPLPQQKKILSKATTEEIMAYLRIKPDLTEKFLEVVSPMARTIIADDIQRPDKLEPEQKNKLLTQLASRLAQAVASGEVKLSEVFSLADLNDPAEPPPHLKAA